MRFARLALAFLAMLAAAGCASRQAAVPDRAVVTATVPPEPEIDVSDVTGLAEEQDLQADAL